MVDINRVLCGLLQEHLVAYAPDVRSPVLVFDGFRRGEDTLGDEVASELLGRCGGYGPCRAEGFEAICLSRGGVVEE